MYGVITIVWIDVHHMYASATMLNMLNEYVIKKGLNVINQENVKNVIICMNSDVQVF